MSIKNKEYVQLTLISMGYFENTTVLGANFVVSSSITIKFGVRIEFDKFSLK